jgi:hypothetical protein
MRPLWASGVTPRLQGTFLQLQTPQLAWQPSDWERLFRCFEELQLTWLIVQWVVYDDVAFHKPSDVQGGAGEASSIGTILRQAALRRMRVLVGLEHRSGYWGALAQGAQEMRNYLRQSEERCLPLARDMVAQLRGNPAFAGWYLSEEIDDESWFHEDMRQMLIPYLRNRRAQLRALTPDAPVALSGFTNARNPLPQVQAFWTFVLDETGIDILLLQDGVGTHKVGLDELTAYLSVISNAAQRSDRPFWVVTELFEQVGGPPVDNGRFRAKPAALDRVCRQLQLAAPFAQALIGFSVPEYMSPFGDLDAGRLYRQYRQWAI